MTTILPVKMSDSDLLDATVRAAHAEQRATADLLALLAEVDARRLYLGEGCSSLFTYCTHVLHLSEHAAYHRIEAARAARRFPVVLDLVKSGDVTLTTVAMLRAHLTPDNHAALLSNARHRSKREVEHQIACLAPKPDATVSRALTVLVEHLERTTIAQVARPRARSKAPGTRHRHIPAPVKRNVWARDGGRCAFIGSHGRCRETGALEFHHLIPFAQGGATDVANISLRCRAHNSFESEEVFGPWPRRDSPCATRSRLRL